MTTAQILETFPRYSALIVGDICLDRWCTYDPAAAEPSRETGIPRIGVISTQTMPGAGGTVANHLAALGVGRAAVLGVLGSDGFAHELTQALNARGISTDLLVRSDALPTFTYTKLVNAASGIEDLPRVDSINTQPLPESTEREVIGHLEDFASSFDVIFVSDQADTKRGGVVTPGVRGKLEQIAEANPDKVIWVESRVRVERFRKMILKPNEQEANSASIGLFGSVDYQRLRAHAQAKLMFVTKGPQGVLVVEDSTETLIPTRPVEKAGEVRGAGDSFSAGAALALAITGSASEAARFGNLVASITIKKRGSSAVTPEDVLAADA
jgi:rfaE bifunctional protein kinase chain/domain